MNKYEIGKDFEIKRSVKDRKFTKNNNFLIAKYINIGYYLISPIILGVLFGVFIDIKFGTKPRFTLFLIFLGSISTFYNLWKLIKES